MAKNARQRRAAKRTIALHTLALTRNPSTQVLDRHVAVRSSPMSVDALKGKTHMGFHASFTGQPKITRTSRKRFAIDGFKS